VTAVVALAKVFFPCRSAWWRRCIGSLDPQLVDHADGRSRGKAVCGGGGLAGLKGAWDGARVKDCRQGLLPPDPLAHAGKGRDEDGTRLTQTQHFRTGRDWSDEEGWLAWIRRSVVRGQGTGAEPVKWLDYLRNKQRKTMRPEIVQP
jgi:hypothetical protein